MLPCFFKKRNCQTLQHLAVVKRIHQDGDVIPLEQGDYITVLGNIKVISRKDGIIMSKFKYKKRADGRYQMSFPYEGKKYYVYGSSLKELEVNKLNKIIELQQGSLDHDNPVLDKYYETFTDLRRSKIKESTIRCQKSSYRNCADVVIRNKTKLGDMRIRDIKPKDIQAVQQALIAKKKYSTRTVNDCMKHLSHVFNAAVKDETIDRNPCRCIEHLRRTEPPARDTIHRALSVEETTAFFKAAAGSTFINCYKLMIQTGMRLGEACALTSADIDQDAGCIHVTKTVTRDEVGGYQIGDTPKTDAGRRDIPLTDIMLQIIKDQKLLLRKYMIFSQLLFPSTEGKILREYTLNRDIKKVCVKAGIEPFTCHAFRATFATRWIEQRPQDYKILSEILGHANIKITLDLYTHVMKESKDEAMKEIEIAM